MQPYDIFMLAVLVGTVLFGFWKGMAWQIASLASVILSAVVAINFSATVASWFGEPTQLNRIITMLALYLITALVIWIVFRLVAKVIDRVKLKEFDHQIGAMFGLVKGVLWCIIITFFVVTLSEPWRQKVLGTYSGRYIAILIKNATPVLPEEVTNVLGSYIEELDRKLDPNTPAESPDEGGAIGTATSEAKSLGQGIVDDLKEGLNEGLNKSGDRLRDGIEGKLDGLQEDIKESVDNARERAQEEINKAPSDR